MLEGGQPSPRRLPFTFHATGAVGRLTLAEAIVGPLAVDTLELEVDDVGDPATTADKLQRRRTRLRALTLHLGAAALDDRLAAVRRQLAGLGVTTVLARICDGYVSVRARATDGLAAADVSFHVQLVNAGTHLRALASHIRVHGHLPIPGPVIADRLLVALLGATDAAGVVERPHARGLCDVEIDLVGALLWQLMPPSGWRLPSVAGVELVHVRIGRQVIDIGYAPAGSRAGDLGVRAHAHQLAAAHDAMHSVDAQLRDGHLEEAMRGYRALLASSGPDQPLLLERILAPASARPAWFFDGLELARQALGRWPEFSAAHAALASITPRARRCARGRESARPARASGVGRWRRRSSGAGGARRCAAAARARSASRHAAVRARARARSGLPEAADALADRLADEQRCPELVRLMRASAVDTPDTARAVALRLRLALVFVHQLGDVPGSQPELEAARLLAAVEPAVLVMTATILAASDPAAAGAAWREGRAARRDARGDHRTMARARGRWSANCRRARPPRPRGIARSRSIRSKPTRSPASRTRRRTARRARDGGRAIRALARPRDRGLPTPARNRPRATSSPSPRCLVALHRGRRGAP